MTIERVVLFERGANVQLAKSKKRVDIIILHWFLKPT